MVLKRLKAGVRRSWETMPSGLRLASFVQFILIIGVLVVSVTLGIASTLNAPAWVAILAIPVVLGAIGLLIARIARQRNIDLDRTIDRFLAADPQVDRQAIERVDREWMVLGPLMGAFLGFVGTTIVTIILGARYAPDVLVLLAAALGSAVGFRWEVQRRKRRYPKLWEGSFFDRVGTWLAARWHRR